MLTSLFACLFVCGVYAESTVLTIAHRVETILDYDKVLVLSAVRSAFERFLSFGSVDFSVVFRLLARGSTTKSNASLLDCYFLVLGPH